MSNSIEGLLIQRWRYYWQFEN